MSSSRCQPRRGASRTWRSSSTRRTEPRRSFQSARAGCKRSRCAARRGVGIAARHGEAAVQERPVESLAVESDENGTFCDARGKFVKERILFGKVAHEELFDLKRACVPPGEPDEKGIGSRAAGQTGSLRVEEEPLGWIFQSGARPARYLGVTRAREKFESDSGWLGKFGRGEPVAKNEMLAKVISGHASTDKTSNGVFLIGLAQSCRTRSQQVARAATRRDERICRRKQPSSHTTCRGWQEQLLWPAEQDRLRGQRRRGSLHRTRTPRSVRAFCE